MGYEPPKEAFDDAFCDDIRVRAKLAIATDGLSIRDLAKRIDIAEGTLGPFLNKKYPGDNMRIARAVERWLKEAADRATFARSGVAPPPFQMTPTAENILHTLDHAQLHGKLVLIALKPGSGKTAACEQQQVLRNRVYLATMRPSTASVGNALAEVLYSMGDPDAREAPSRMARRIAAKVREPGGLIIIDEAQHASVSAIEELRSIQDETRCGMALVGDQRLHATFENSAYSQLRRRIARRCSAVKSLDRDIEVIAAAWGVADANMVAFLQRVARKPGALGGVTNVMQSATELSRLEGEPISLDHLRVAWGDLMPEVAL